MLRYELMDHKLKILIVDDEPDVIDIVRGFLGEAYDTVTANSVSDALAAMVNDRPDIIISDLKMPDANGLMLLRESKSDLRQVPFILMSGHGDKEHVIEALRLNAFDYLQKPFLGDELNLLVGRAAKHVKLLRDLDSANLKFLRASRIAAAGEIAGGVAHEVNTPLASLNLIFEQIQNATKFSMNSSSEVSELVQEGTRTVSRIAEIVKSLLSFSKSNSPEACRPYSVNRILEETLSVCKGRIEASGALISLKALRADRAVECRPLEISQVLLSLVCNSCDAVISLPQKWIEIAAEVVGRNVEISVTDSGVGIGTDVRKNLFQPFFTTKKWGEGKGLSLCVAKGILEDQGGSIFFDEARVNTRFVLRVPLAKGATQK